jgi:hypothetical protein
MSGELEAAGALATAGAVAGALEGREGGAPGESNCANCGAALTGPFCSQCGQHAHPHRKLTHVFEEFLHGLLHLDTKTWRTIPMVIARPGTLTRNYVYGKRARYLSPLTLFLFTIFLLFFVFSFVDAPVGMAGTPEEQRAGAVEALNRAREEVTRAQRELEAARLAPPDQYTGDLDVRLAEQEVTLAQAQVQRMETLVASIDQTIARREAGETESTEPDEGVQVEGISWSPGETWQDGVRRLAESDDFVVVQGMPQLNERVRQRFRNPDLALYSIQEAASKFSFLLAPLTLHFIMLLFLWKRGVTLYDHMAYALYALAFAALMFSAIIIVGAHAWTSWLAGWMFGLGFPVHTFFHLKGAYALGWWSALWRTFFMLAFAMIVASVYLVLIVILGLTG